jgi:hypothetical protein
VRIFTPGLANQCCQARRRPITARKTQDVVAGGREHFGDAGAEPFGGTR